MSTKEKAVNGLVWSFIETFSSLVIQFIVGVILARILDPREFGLIGMLTIFIAISQSFVDSGITSALVRKKKCNSSDYSTAFVFNFLTSILFYLILFFLSNQISLFFNEPLLSKMLKVLGLGLVFNSLGMIQRTILIKNVNFKLQMNIALSTSLITGVIAIIMALNDYGVWSLVALTVMRSGITSLLLWLFSKWKISIYFDLNSFKELFGFGSKIMLSGLIDTAYRNSYFAIIGKLFTAETLGFFTRADQFSNLLAQNITKTIQRVSYPVLANMQDDFFRLKFNHRRIIKGTMFISFTTLMGLAVIAKPLFISLIGEKWIPAVIYLQLLCFVGMFEPLNTINMNMLKVLGKASVFLKLEFIKKICFIPIIFFCALISVKAIILGLIVFSIISFCLNAHWSGKTLNYSIFDQIKDILPSFIFAILVNMILFLISMFLEVESFFKLLVLVLSGPIIVVIVGELFQAQEYVSIKKILVEKLKNFKN